MINLKQADKNLKSTNPVVIWDGYGLDQKNSGILSHAKSLAAELTKNKIQPIIFGQQACSDNFPDLTVIPLWNPALFSKFYNSKIIWRRRIAKQIEKSLNQYTENQTIILHGLSNINLPGKIRLTNQTNTTLKIKKVITIHDLIPLLAPKSVSKPYYHQFKYLLPIVMKQADVVIAVSQWTAQGLAQLFPKYKNKIIVIENGFESFDKKQKFNLPPLATGSVLDLLTVSRYEIYKQFDLLLEILYKKPKAFRLTLVTNATGVKWAQKEAAALLRSGSLRVLTAVSDEDLKKLYRNSHALVHPSLYEGFCLPAAESLASGTPVVYQSGTALNETVGHAVGVPIKPGASVFDWIAGIEYAANMKYTQEFYRNIGDHLDRCASWEESGEKLAKVYLDLSAN